MGTDYAKITEEAIGEPVQAAGLFQPAGEQWSHSVGGGSGILMALNDRGERRQIAKVTDLPRYMVIGVTDSKIHVFEAKAKIGHYEIAGPALYALDRSSTQAEKHMAGAEAEGLSLTAADGTRVEVEAPRLTGHGTDVIKLLVS